MACNVSNMIIIRIKCNNNNKEKDFLGIPLSSFLEQNNLLYYNVSVTVPYYMRCSSITSSSSSSGGVCFGFGFGVVCKVFDV